MSKACPPAPLHDCPTISCTVVQSVHLFIKLTSLNDCSRIVQSQSNSYRQLRSIAQAMGMVSRVLLFRFLNISFVRRYFYDLISDNERRAWLNAQIQVGRIGWTRGLSMYPTFTGDREFVFILPFSYSKGIWPRVGDVVSFIEPNRTDKAWVQKQTEHRDLGKRIAGFGGYCGYLETGWRGVPASKVIVPRGYCWVLRDNRLISRDSRRFGPVPLAFLLGRYI